MSGHFDYEAFGLVWRTPFACPGLVPASDGRPVDVEVDEGPVPRTLDAPQLSERGWEAEPGRFLLRGGIAAGRFLVEHGHVTLQRHPDADDARLARLFTDRVLAAALRQRGFLVLHAGAAASTAGAVVVAGDSGAGKSTTLAALLERGWPMLADDICALHLDDATGVVRVEPGIAQMHLTQDSADGVGVDFDAHRVQPWRRMKAAVPTHRRMAAAPVALGAIHVLVARADIADVDVSRLVGAAKLAALQAAVYGPMLPAEHPALFALQAAVLRDVSILRIDRPALGWSLDEVVRVVEPSLASS